MKRTVTLALVVALLLVALGSGAALAADVVCPDQGPCVSTNEDDTMHGSPQSDLLFASDGDDTLFGNGGNDDLHADGFLGEDPNERGEWVRIGAWEHAGNDTLVGGRGNDYLFGYNGADEFRGEDGSDRISALDSEGLGNQGVDTVFGGDGNDSITARDGFADIITCGKGKKDFVYFDTGLDRVNRKTCERRASPQGDDLQECLPVAYPPEEWPGQSPARHLSIGRIVGDGGDNTLVGTNHQGCIDAIEGEGGDDTLRGLSGWNVLAGGPGDDFLQGGAGEDALFGTYGRGRLAENSSDEIRGGDGPDFIDVHDIDEVPDLVYCGAGVDLVLPDNLEGPSIDNINNCEEVVFGGDEGFFKWARRCLRR